MIIDNLLFWPLEILHTQGIVMSLDKCRAADTPEGRHNRNRLQVSERHADGGWVPSWNSARKGDAIHSLDDNCGCSYLLCP